MKKWKVSERDYQFIEENVRLYPFYKRRLEDIERDLILSTPIRPEGGKSNLPGRPVERIVIQLFDDSRIQRLRRYVESVEFALEELDAEKERFVRFIFWSRDGKDIKKIMNEFAISQQTYTRWKKAFLLRVGLLTGDYQGDL